MIRILSLLVLVLTVITIISIIKDPVKPNGEKLPWGRHRARISRLRTHIVVCHREE
ncbi:Uncharacterised protein [Mycobacteroides abscessus subsp. abscessus]|nr:Uncharacterised protein [Mycobacteroides abscessus subsp. abscessus]